jgi:predicted enzyme related to lactoylglutathione lyase
MPTIVHFEIPADDVERAKKFYTDLFGWKTTNMKMDNKKQVR